MKLNIIQHLQVNEAACLYNSVPHRCINKPDIMVPSPLLKDPSHQPFRPQFTLFDYNFINRQRKELTKKS